MSSQQVSVKRGTPSQIFHSTSGMHVGDQLADLVFNAFMTLSIRYDRDHKIKLTELVTRSPSLMWMDDLGG